MYLARQHYFPLVRLIPVFWKALLWILLDIMLCGIEVLRLILVLLKLSAPRLVTGIIIASVCQTPLALPDRVEAALAHRVTV